MPPGGGDDDIVDPLPFFPSDDDFVGPPEPPEYDEIPQGEIEVGPPGDSQPARDAIDQIGDITEVGDPLDELGDIELPVPDILPTDSPVVEPDVPDYTDDLWGSDEVVLDVPDYTNDLSGLDEGVDVVPDYTNDLWGPDQSLSDQDLLEMTLFDLMAQELLTGGGGGGGPMNNMNILAYE